VVLFDEVEKAHPEVLNVLLQLLDDGRLTDGKGRTVDFKNAVVIMTSNLGSDILVNMTDDADMEVVRPMVLDVVRKHFRPEFLNRIDEIVIFRQLTDEQLWRITDLMLDETRRRLRAQDVDIEVTDAAVEWLVERGFQPEYGARPLRRTIQRELDNRLSRMVLGGELPAHSRVRVDVADGRLVLRREEGAHPVAG
jgi:ATP-dependent Clp protease ATP-binding subunit ClpC